MNQQNKEILDIREWTCNDFKAVFDAIVQTHGEERAWEMIYIMWQIRAREITSERSTKETKSYE